MDSPNEDWTADLSHRATLEFHDHVVTLAESLRPLPTTLSRLAEAIAIESSTVNDVTTILRQDAGIVAALLRESNSAALFPTSEVGTIEGAVVRLGFARVLAIATKAALNGVADIALPAYDMSRLTNERYAVAVSYVAEAIYAESPTQLGPESVTAAVLHDIGQIVMDKLLDPHHFEEARNRHLLITAAERELIDVDHAELGALLLELWDVPKPIIDGVRHHHQPQLSEGLIAHAVFVADQIANELVDTGHRPSSDPEIEAMLQHSLGALRVDRQEVTDRAFSLFDRAEF